MEWIYDEYSVVEKHAQTMQFVDLYGLGNVENWSRS